MKVYKYILAVTAGLYIFALAGCNRVDESVSDFDNVVYIQQAESTDTETVKFKTNDRTGRRTLQAALALPANRDVTVNYSIDLSQVDHYNQAHYTSYLPLPEQYFELATEQAVIQAGNVRSPEVEIRLSGIEDMPRDVYYLLPVTISNWTGGVDVLEGARTLYYVVSKGATINTAAYMGENYLTVPGFDNPTGSGRAVQDMQAVTYEAMLHPRALTKSISTIMGVEDYFLVRMGDLLAKDQLHLAIAIGANVSSSALKLETGKWTHFAMTYDCTSRELIFYLNGEEKYRLPALTSYFYNYVSLGVNPKNTNKFHIGYSYAADRYFDGDMCEVRIWNTVRSASDIRDNMYEVDPATPGLVAYWKMDEGSGSQVKDYSSYGNHATANSPLTWIPASLPEE